MEKKILELLYRSFDGELTKREEEILERELARSGELRIEKERITAMRDLISRTAAEGFSPHFTGRLMERIIRMNSTERYAEQFFASLLFLFRRVAIAGTVVAVLMVAYNMKTSGKVSVSAAFAAPELTIEELVEPPDPFTLESP